MTQKTVLIIAIVFLLTILIVKAQSKPPELPAAFYGFLTINSQPAAVGSVIIAKIDGEERGSITTTESGKYGGPRGIDQKLLVSGNNNDRGKIISFVINNLEADQTATWQPGEIFNLDLGTQFSIFPTTTPPSVDTGGSSGGGVGGGGTESIVHNLGEISNGRTDTFNQRDIALFLIGNRQYTARLNGIASNYIEIIINSISSRITLGETKQFDLDNDNINDLAITLNDISSRRANLRFISLQSPLASSNNIEAVDEESEESSGLEGITGGAVDVASKSGRAIGIGILIIVVILGVLGYLSIRKKQQF